MNRVVTIALTSLMMASAATTINAQDKAEFSIGADVVSSYVWRGVYQTGVSVQPGMEISYKGFSLGAWGSTDFDLFKEVDFSLGYSTGGFSATVTDYWWDGQFSRYGGDYDNSHRLEGTLAYTFCEVFPLTASWSTFFLGEDEKENGDRAYSTYVELAYPFSIGEIDLLASVGAAPWTSPTWLPTDNTGFQVANISLAAAKEIEVTEKYSIPVFIQLSLNPAMEDIQFIFGISF